MTSRKKKLHVCVRLRIYVSNINIDYDKKKSASINGRVFVVKQSAISNSRLQIGRSKRPPSVRAAGISVLLLLSCPLFSVYISVSNCHRRGPPRTQVTVKH